jgi:hypothetical protein
MFFLKPNKNHSFLAEKEEYNKKKKNSMHETKHTPFQILRYGFHLNVMQSNANIYGYGLWN